MFVALVGQALAQQEPDRDGDGLPDRLEGPSGTDASLPDTDGDGLLDGWEVNGYTAGGWVEPLHLYGANPLVKDVFVELDWMASPDGDPASEEANALHVYQAAIDVTRAFNNSGTGIRIHFDLGPDILTRIPAEAVEPDADFSAFATAPDIGKILPYQERFPARPALVTGDRLSTSLTNLYDAANNPHFFRVSRRHLFYYVVFAEKSSPVDAADGDAGKFHPFVDDFADDAARHNGLAPAGHQVGVFYRLPHPGHSDPKRVRYHYSVSLFHELGHAFGLGHGGALPGNRWDNTNFKVNYPSIMNHRYQFWGVDSVAGLLVMDFSYGKLSPVSELELFEPLGMGAAVNQHLLSNLNVSHLPDLTFPLNVDWNRDGRVTVTVVRGDLNQNGLIEPEVSKDHDDWGKLVRDGFDGIGRRAFSGCGPACDLRIVADCVHGDFNGDDLTDLFFASATAMTWSLGGSGGPRSYAAPTGVFSTIDARSAHPHQSFVAGDFVGSGSDVLLWQRPGVVALIEHSSLGPQLIMESVGEVLPSSSLVKPWSLEGPPAAFLPLRLSGLGQQLVTTDGRGVAVLVVGENDGEDVLTTSWRHEFLGRTGPAAVSVQEGRTFSSGLQSLFVTSPRGRYEVRFPSGGFEPEGDPAREPSVRRMNPGGALQPAPGVTDRFALSDTDTLLTVDLDGDDVEELVVLGTGRIALARWNDQQPELLWAEDESIAGWRLDETWNQLYHAQFLVGGGEELVLSNGRVWITLAWTPQEGVQVLAVNVDTLSPGSFVPLTAEVNLLPEQRVFPGKFVQGSPEALLVFDGSLLALAAFDSNPLDPGQESPIPMRGFRVHHWNSKRVDGWVLGDEDRLTRIQGDTDPQTELLVQKGDVFGILELHPANRASSSFVRRFDSEQLVFSEVRTFRRGDVNLDGGVDISDASRFLAFLFLGDDLLPCEDAADVNDSGRIDIADAVFILSFLFLDRILPPEPGPDNPGIDPSLDALDCAGI